MARSMKFFGVRFALLSALGTTALWMALTFAPQQQVSHLPSSKGIDHHVQNFVMVEPAAAQRLTMSDVATLVYESMPSIPLENQYIDDETGDVDTDNTLLSRFIRYHVYVTRRSPLYRLDWKITFADYLGLNEWMRDEEYPGAADLTENPRRSDTDVISQLNRAQRDALIDELITVFTTEGNRIPTYGGR